MRELLDIKWERKKKEKTIITDHMIGKKSRENASCVAVFFGEAK